MAALLSEHPTAYVPPALTALRPWPDVIEMNASADDCSGYGSFAGQIRRGLTELGVQVIEDKMVDIIRSMPSQPQTPRLAPTPWGGLRWIGDDGEPVKFGTKGRNWACNHGLLSWPEDADLSEPVTRRAVKLAVGLPEGARYLGADRRVLFTMWESTEIPRKLRAWAPHLRRTNLVLVPAEHSRSVIHDVCPDVRVDLVPLGLEVDAWPFLDRSDRREDRPFIFLQVGDLSARKGYALAYEAFYRAFGESKDAALVFKTRGANDFCVTVYRGKTTQVRGPDGHAIRNALGDPVKVWNREPWRWVLNTTDPNVKTLRGNWRRPALMRLYQMADCFVWPSLGEGWGYPPREAAATGLPVITCAHTGMMDAPEWAYVIPHKERAVRAIFNAWGGDCGYFPLPDVDALTEQMRWVFEHRDDARAFGARASEVVTRRTSAHVAADILDAVATL